MVGRAGGIHLEKGGRYLDDYVCAGKDSDEVHFTVDYYYRAICCIPHTYEEAMRSAYSEE